MKIPAIRRVSLMLASLLEDVHWNQCIGLLTEAREEYEGVVAQLDRVVAELRLLKPHKDCDISCMLSCTMEGKERARLAAENAELVKVLQSYDGSHANWHYESDVMPSNAWNEQRCAALTKVKEGK